MLKTLLGIHYYIMTTRKDFWSDPLLIRLDALICVTASNVRKEEMISGVRMPLSDT